MCKHVDAVLYGIGARLDEDPVLFFTLRAVDIHDLITRAIQNKTQNMLRKSEASQSKVVSSRGNRRTHILLLGYYDN
ncbi:MAG: hypothetical protein PHC92_03825 [Syntrophomonadaceae bacterium]|nr:hypothetical protein [Syntrophomonadaceae bacterium]